ncbi:hypothetical protein DPMN_137835 [Dreissena polymorpha]|uniref:Uncharacterized protein n=1 Tax=Dreissena polymorpha TaxID=45954 RepID=A0A9D4JGR3_DREPO|nr:hypothetical protein DPMN_137835 [Dreissena polymorpha]
MRLNVIDDLMEQVCRHNATNESSLSNSALNKSESFQDAVSDPETFDPPTKRLKQRAIGFESSWKQDFTCLTEVEGICKRASAK